MDAVADEFGEEAAVVEDDAEDAGLAVVQRAHGVEGVGGAGGSGGDGGAGFGGDGVGVADGNFYAVGGGVRDEVKCAGCFGGDGDEADVVAGGGLKTVEEFDGGWLDFGWRMHAAFCVRDEGTFEMDADGDGLVVGGGRFNGAGDAFECAEGGVDGRGDGGGEVVRDSAGGEELADDSEGFGGGLHDVVVGGAVSVDVEEGGGEGGAVCRGRTGGDGFYSAFGVDFDARVVDGVGGEELAGGEGLGHFSH